MEIVAESEDEIAVILTKHEFRMIGTYVGQTDSDLVDMDKGLTSIWNNYKSWCISYGEKTIIFNIIDCKDNAISFKMIESYKNEM